jgi:hypothetical protein
MTSTTPQKCGIWSPENAPEGPTASAARHIGRLPHRTGVTYQLRSFGKPRAGTYGTAGPVQKVHTSKPGCSGWPMCFVFPYVLCLGSGQRVSTSSSHDEMKDGRARQDMSHRHGVKPCARHCRCPIGMFLRGVMRYLVSATRAPLPSHGDALGWWPWLAEP